jgi:hypothetical protein
MEGTVETSNAVYLTFKSKNDTDDAHIYFPGRRAHGWRSISCRHRFTGFTPSSLCGCHRGHSQPPHSQAVVYVLDLLGEHIPIRVNIKRAHARNKRLYDRTAC